MLLKIANLLIIGISLLICTDMLSLSYHAEQAGLNADTVFFVPMFIVGVYGFLWLRNRF